MRGGIVVQIPQRFRIDRKEMAALCGWHMQAVSGDLYRVQLQEVYDKSAPKLITAVRVADATSASSRVAYEPFQRWEDQDGLYRGPIQTVAQVAVERYETATTPVEKWGALRPALTTAKDSEFPDRLREAFEELAKEDAGASLWAATIPRRLGWRLASVRALFGSQETPELLKRRDQDMAGFPASKGLMAGLSFGYDSFVETALIATSPWVLGWNVPRVGGIAVELFGQPLLGAQPTSQLLDHFRPPAWPAASRMFAPHKPDVTSSDIAAWFRWWIERLDQLFGLLSDPTRFPGPDGRYLARNHLAMWLSVVRLFLTVHAILAHPFESFERVVLFFSALDLLDGLRLGGVELGEPRQARKALDEVVAVLPPGAAAVVLPRCERAVRALDDVRQGFFVKERIKDGTLSFGTGQTIGIDKAIAQWLRLARNSHHGFGQIARDKPDAVALLAAHDGTVPPELSDIAFLYLLRLLVEPRRLFPDDLRAERRAAAGGQWKEEGSLQ